MPRVKIDPVTSDQTTFEIEIARLRDLDFTDLKARWHTLFGRRPPPQLPRHLLFRMLAYKLQADRLGDLDADSKRLLDRAASPDAAGKRAVEAGRIPTVVRPGTILSREWQGRIHPVAVLTDGFAWNGKTYASLSKVAFAITGTRWNGPRFFGLRDRTPEARS